MNSIVRQSLPSVAAACVILFICTGYVHLFWLQCGGRDVHAWPNNYLCWYLPEFIAGTVGLVGLVIGYALGTKGTAVAGIAAFVALVAFRLQGDFPFGSGASYALSGLLYVALPAVVGSMATSRVIRGPRKNAP